MFLHRFPEASDHGVNIKQLRGMEGKRVKQTCAGLGLKYGVTGKGRDDKTENRQLAAGIDRALSASNATKDFGMRVISSAANCQGHRVGMARDPSDPPDLSDRFPHPRGDGRR